MTVTEIASVEHFNKIHSTSEGKLVVVDFTATWCGPCKMMAPIFHELAETFKGQAIFCSCNVDAARDVATQEKISAMPTFIFYKGGKRIDEIVGANAALLKEKVAKLAVKTSVFSSKGFSLLSGSSSTSGSSSKVADRAPSKRINPWADPNFVPPGMRQSASANSVKTEQKPSPGSPKASAPKTPWSDPSFMPKQTGVSVKKDSESTETRSELQKPAESAEDAELAKAIAMSLDVDQPSGSEAKNDPNLVKTIDQNLLTELIDMGFPRIRAEKSLILTKAKTMEAATNWLIEHEQDTDIDEPLTVVGTAPNSVNPDEMYDDEDDGLNEAIRSVREKAAKAKDEARKLALQGQESVDMSKMTKEEKLAYLERLKTIRKTQREKQEREEAKQKEIERQKNVKAALEAKRAREEQQAAMAAARAKREKEAERARQKRIEEKLRLEKEARIKARMEREQKKTPAADLK